MLLKHNAYEKNIPVFSGLIDRISLDTAADKLMVM